MAREADTTQARRLASHLRFSDYQLQKSLKSFESDYQPSIDREVIAELSTPYFVEEMRHVLLLGLPWVGKTHCETALCDSLKESWSDRP
jgi:DNA replication protein DnaC